MIETDEFSYDVFLSYKRDDQSEVIADRLHYVLRRAGYLVWQDRENIRPGKEWPGEISSAIERSRIVVAVVSKKYLRSPVCDNEYFLGCSFRGVIPVLVDGTPAARLPWPIGSRTWLRYGQSEAIVRLVDEVARLREEFPKRTSLLGKPYPAERGATAALLRGLYGWPPRATRGRIEAADAIQQAEDQLREVPEISGALNGYNNFSELPRALSEIRERLLKRPSTASDWQAFAVLAQPFRPYFSEDALRRAGFAAHEIRAAVGTPSEDLLKNYRDELCQSRTEEFELESDPIVAEALDRLGIPRGSAEREPTPEAVNGNSEGIVPPLGSDQPKTRRHWILRDHPAYFVVLAVLALAAATGIGAVLASVLG